MPPPPHPTSPHHTPPQAPPALGWGETTGWFAQTMVRCETMVWGIKVPDNGLGLQTMVRGSKPWSRTPNHGLGLQTMVWDSKPWFRTWRRPRHAQRRLWLPETRSRRRPNGETQPITHDALGIGGTAYCGSGRGSPRAVTQCERLPCVPSGGPAGATKSVRCAFWRRRIGTARVFTVQ